MSDLEVLSIEQQVLLSSVAQHRRIDEHEAIVRQGDPAAAIYLIESGTVSVEIDHLGSPVQVNELGPGEIFGEISFVDGGAASATCVASTEVEVAVFDQRSLDELIASNPALAAAIFRAFAVVLAGRLRRHGAGAGATMTVLAPS